MLKSLFVNSTILISFLYLGNQILKKEKINLNSKLQEKILLGSLLGITGCVLMFYSIQLSEDSIMDFRTITMIISSIYGGFISTIITAFIIIVFRLSYYGISTASLVATYDICILLFLFTFVSKCKISFFKKYITMSIFNIVSLIIAFSILLKDINVLTIALRNLIFSTTFLSGIVYYNLIYISKTNELYRKLNYDAKKDFLTGLNNVRTFDNILNKLINNAIEKEERLSILMIDIDFFKNINDNYGHYSGDLVLKQLSNILVSSSRGFDVVSRNGGEEFTVILLDCNFTHATTIAERIRKNVEEYIFTSEGNRSINITVSIGISSYPDITTNINDLLAQADDALYLAKRTGRNKVC
ncbi:diguanylate cyclase [Clostridium gasigenes]|uniref:diguanylate cyclase n=1 Tax=Clostridium gasigenes TaxID=94869 RepID=UPI001C0DA6A4|nr:diguanylate cyclase [Clostridium gasigenes]MBU3088191.1 diguanylate cyclase [Clostridium gasigenes]